CLGNRRWRDGRRDQARWLLRGDGWARSRFRDGRPRRGGVGRRVGRVHANTPILTSRAGPGTGRSRRRPWIGSAATRAARIVMITGRFTTCQRAARWFRLLHLSQEQSQNIILRVAVPEVLAEAFRVLHPRGLTLCRAPLFHLVQQVIDTVVLSQPGPLA